MVVLWLLSQLITILKTPIQHFLTMLQNVSQLELLALHKRAYIYQCAVHTAFIIVGGQVDEMVQIWKHRVFPQCLD